MSENRDYEEEKRLAALEDAKKRTTTTLQSKEHDELGLEVYYCRACGTYALVLATQIHKLPRRRTDGSYVVEVQAHGCRLSLEKGKVVAVKRDAGVEKQYRFQCSSCDLVIAYQNSDFESSPKYVYVCESALTNNPSAFLKVKQHHGDVPACIDKDKEKESEEGAAGGSSKAGPACRLFVEVTPEAPRTQLVAINDTAVTILATGSSQGARVNEEVLSFLAFVLGVGPGAVTLEGGSKSAKKTLRVAGLGPREAHDRLFAALR
eukprot:tig00021339_g20407.t1